MEGCGSDSPAGDPNSLRDNSPTGVDAREMGERDVCIDE